MDQRGHQPVDEHHVMAGAGTFGPLPDPVVVVQPGSAGWAAGARPVWPGLVKDPDATEDIAAWVRAGGPGVAPCPPILDLYVFTPPRRVRAAQA